MLFLPLHYLISLLSLTSNVFNGYFSSYWTLFFFLLLKPVSALLFCFFLFIYFLPFISLRLQQMFLVLVNYICSYFSFPLCLFFLICFFHYFCRLFTGLSSCRPSIRPFSIHPSLPLLILPSPANRHRLYI